MSIMNEAGKVRHVVSIAGVVQERSERQNDAEENHKQRDEKPPPRRIANAWVRIIVHTAPLAFQSRVLAMLAALYADSFTIELGHMELDDYVTQLDTGKPSDALLALFQMHGRIISQQATIVPNETGSNWQLVDAGKSYMIWRFTDKLRLYCNARDGGMLIPSQRKRIDHTWSRADGVFYFLDLPPGEDGESYQLRVSVPDTGTRYGTVECKPIQVQTNAKDERVQPAWVPVELSSTRLRDTV